MGYSRVYGHALRSRPVDQVAETDRARCSPLRWHPHAAPEFQSQRNAANARELEIRNCPDRSLMYPSESGPLPSTPTGPRTVTSEEAPCASICHRQPTPLHLQHDGAAVSCRRSKSVRAVLPEDRSMPSPGAHPATTAHQIVYWMSPSKVSASEDPLH